MYTVNVSNLRVKDGFMDSERSQDYEELLPVNIANEM
jgi:hypothetical protein